jgi:hypothetical protein
MVYRISVFLLLFTCSLSWTACYDSPEGCRDINASNYDVKADIDCENDCCKYSDLILSINHLYGEIEIDTNSIISHPQSGDIRIRSLVFFLTDISLKNGSEHQQSKTTETIQVGIESNGETEFLNHLFPVAKIKLGKTDDYVLGNFRNADLYKATAFDFGIKDSINFGDLSNIPSSNPLYQNPDSMYISKTEGFYFLKASIAYGLEEEKDILISGSQNKIMLDFDHNFDFRNRGSRIMNCVIDYEKWLKEINFETDSDDLIKEKLSQNLPSSILFI